MPNNTTRELLKEAENYLRFLADRLEESHYKCDMSNDTECLVGERATDHAEWRDVCALIMHVREALG